MLFAVQIASNALFYHSHTIDGQLYSHAHPGCDGHSHNAADFVFYQQLQNMLSEESPKLLAEQYPVLVSSIPTEVSTTFFNAFYSTNTGRAPPVA